jgi:tetratricopeptide (TPR) repeat protein
VTEATVPEAADRAPPSEPRGGAIGRYVVLDVLGQGGMGVVYAAFDPQLDRKVAIKVLHRLGANASREAQDRLLREAQAMARLSHPNVVAVHDVGTFETSVFLAMEFVEGTTLKGWLQGEGSGRSWRARLEALKATGRGLAAAHAAGLVHRDFKPDNVLVGRDGRARVTDFGIARSTADACPAEPSGPPRVPRAARTPLGTPLTETGSVLGTIGYMAPEQAVGAEADARSDQFSFCVTLYVALYGERPFRGETLEDYVEALARPVRDPPAGTKVPTWLRRVVVRGLQEDPARRYPSLEALLLALDQDPATTRRRWLVAAAAMVAAALVTGGLRYTTRHEARACLHAAPALAGVWDDEVKRDARDAFLATGAPNAADAFDRSAKVLDGYASAWTAMYVQACEATRVVHEQPEDVYRMRGDCLDRQRVELRALTSLLRHADAQVVDMSISAAYGLPPLRWCEDVKALRSSLGLPDDPVKRARVQEARQAIAEADALALGDKNEEARGVAERALDLARSASHESTEAEALYVLGYAQTRLVDEAAAEESLANAAWAGMASGHYAVVVRASAIEAYITGVELQRAEESRDWLARAKGALAKMGGNDELEAFLTSREASILHGLAHRPELALPLAENAVRTYRRLYGAHPSTERELRNLGNVYEALGRADLALATYEEALAMSEKLYGPASLRAAIALAHVGDAELKLGRVPEATARLERALAVFEGYQNAFWIVATLQDLTQSSNRSGDPKAALALGERGLALLEKPDASPVLVPASCVTTADALLALGRPAEALALCDRALAAQEKAGSVAVEKVYEWDALRCRGEALIAAGKAREAILPLERSLAIARREWPGDLARARFALARALAQSQGDLARARTLATQAHDELASHDEMKPQLAAVDAWEAEHGPAR